MLPVARPSIPRLIHIYDIPSDILTSVWPTQKEHYLLHSSAMCRALHHNHIWIAPIEPYQPPHCPRLPLQVRLHNSSARQPASPRLPSMFLSPGAPDRYDNVIYDLYLTSFIVYQFAITTERAKYTELAPFELSNRQHDAASRRHARYYAAEKYKDVVVECLPQAGGSIHYRRDCRKTEYDSHLYDRQFVQADDMNGIYG
ncbi:hypothetical protein BDR06DRAFT_1023505 [Suillus hirtellus]|nr:hypothetical protein BDR06DRAFT_1023505 [Suillus hirtellus]